MGFTEIVIILVIAILFLGPDKLPTAMIDIAKFFRSVKKTIGSLQDTLEEELNISDIKEEALSYKKQLLEAKTKLDKVTKLPDSGALLADLTNLTDHNIDEITEVKEEPKNKVEEVEEIEEKEEIKEIKEERVTFKKKTKKRI